MPGLVKKDFMNFDKVFIEHFEILLAGAGKGLGKYALDKIKSYPEDVYANTKHERERLAARAARYREKREEEQRRARERTESKKEEEAGAKAGARAWEIADRQAASRAAKNRNDWRQYTWGTGHLPPEIFR